MGQVKPDKMGKTKTESMDHCNRILHLRVRTLQTGASNPEHVLYLSLFKGVAPSLSIPLILSSITASDDEQIIVKKMEVVAHYNDTFAIYRLILNDSITQSSIEYTFNNLALEVRDSELGPLADSLKNKNSELVIAFKKIDFIPFDKGYSKYLLARIYKHYHPEIPFEELNFQRKRDSLVLYQFFKESDVEPVTNSIPTKLKDLFFENLTSYCLVPKSHISNYDRDPVVDRIKLLVRNGYFPELSNEYSFNPKGELSDFFINRNKALKHVITMIWRN